MKCKECDGVRFVLLKRDSEYTKPCPHCNGTGMEPVNEVELKSVDEWISEILIAFDLPIAPARLAPIVSRIITNACAFERAENVKKLKAMEERCRTISRRDAKDQNLKWAAYFSHKADVFKEAAKEIEEQE